MPLSDYERKRLQELEMDLAAEDPVLARELASGTPPGRRLRRIAGVSLALAGTGLLILGVAVQLPALGVLGFLMMCGGASGYPRRRAAGS